MTRSIDGSELAVAEDVDIKANASHTRKDRPMFSDFRNELATIRQQELLGDAARQRVGRPDRMGRPDLPVAPSFRIGRLIRRLAGPTTA